MERLRKDYSLLTYYLFKSLKPLEPFPGILSNKAGRPLEVIYDTSLNLFPLSDSIISFLEHFYFEGPPNYFLVCHNQYQAPCIFAKLYVMHTNLISHYIPYAQRMLLGHHIIGTKGTLAHPRKEWLQADS